MTPADRDKLADQLRIDEGDVPHAYQDSRGFWTIGVGRLIDKRLGGRLTPEERTYLLNNDISQVFAEIQQFFPWVDGMAPARRVAFANLLFNLGLKKMQGFHSTIPALASGRYERAAELLGASLWAKQVQPSRRDRIIAALRSGV